MLLFNRRLDRALHPCRAHPHTPPPPRSYITYYWYGGLLRLGFRRTLQYSDVFAVPPALLTSSVQPRFAAEFKRQKAVAEGLGDKVRAAALELTWGAHSS